MKSATSTEEHTVFTYNCRTNVDGDIKPGIGHKLYEFNKKTGYMQRCVFKKVKDTRWDKLMLKWFGMNKPYPHSYFFTALNEKSAIKHIENKFNCNFIKVISE